MKRIRAFSAAAGAGAVLALAIILLIPTHRASAGTNDVPLAAGCVHCAFIAPGMALGMPPDGGGDSPFPLRGGPGGPGGGPGGPGIMRHPGPHPDDMGGPPDSIEEHLFPPHEVMAHQQELGLTDEQKAKITEEVKKMMSEMIDTQFAVQEGSEALAKLLDQSPVDETAALEQAGKLMTMERDVKRSHLRLLIRIKNALTVDQQSKLKSLRAQP